MLDHFNTASQASAYILTINAGSSSIKASVYDTAKQLHTVGQCTIENIGQSDVVVHTTDADGTKESSHQTGVKNHADATELVIDWIDHQQIVGGLLAIGHRIVHGGPTNSQTQQITDQLIEDLHAFSSFDPDHLPFAIRLIENLQDRYPGTKQIACFDSAFYEDMPRLAKILPLPRQYEELGLHRYGFHGLSYSYLLSDFRQHEGEAAANGRVIFAHLGSGASLTAVKNGKPVDTTMGFTPTSGVMMSTRSGDLDPSIGWFLNKKAGLSIEDFNTMVNHKSGLLGVSETSADMYTLLQNEDHDERAVEAVSLFCYQVKKAIGSLTAVLGGLDSVVFSGGIGEQAPVIRQRICSGLDFLGIRLDEELNGKQARLISGHDSGVGVHIIHTDEGMVIAQQTREVISRMNIRSK